MLSVDWGLIVCRGQRAEQREAAARTWPMPRKFEPLLIIQESPQMRRAANSPARQGESDHEAVLIQEHAATRPWPARTPGQLITSNLTASTTDHMHPSTLR